MGTFTTVIESVKTESVSSEIVAESRMCNPKVYASPTTREFPEMLQVTVFPARLCRIPLFIT